MIDFSKECFIFQHGYWKKSNYGYPRCSICNYELTTEETKYCPHCGAKMDGVETDG